MKKKLLNLAKEMGFNSGIEYFDYLIDSHINGNFKQCKELFSEMGKEDKKAFLNYLNGKAYHCGLLEVRNFYFNLMYAK